MTIAILIHRTWQSKMPRPFNRADQVSEMVEMLERAAVQYRATRKYPQDWKIYAKAIDTSAIDTDEPVMSMVTNDGIADFYAYRER